AGGEEVAGDVRTGSPGQVPPDRRRASPPRFLRRAEFPGVGGGAGRRLVRRGGAGRRRGRASLTLVGPRPSLPAEGLTALAARVHLKLLCQCDRSDPDDPAGFDKPRIRQDDVIEKARHTTPTDVTT